MGKTRDLFKKIGDTKGTFHAKMGSIKDRNGMDLTEAEDKEICITLLTVKGRIMPTVLGILPLFFLALTKSI